MSITVDSPEEIEFSVAPNTLVLPGQKLRSAAQAVKGRGTYEAEGDAYSSLTGIFSVVDQLVYVAPVGKARYFPEVGDIVVGRIERIGGDRWYVDLGGYLRGVLPLGNVQLPGGEQRRRTYLDMHDMRKLYQETDVVCLEVQHIGSDGAATLHCRNTKYGTLRDGVLLNVPSCLIRRMPNHILVFENIGVTVVLGANGMVWVTRIVPDKQISRLSGSVPQPQTETATLESVTAAERLNIARTRNVVLILGEHNIPITKDSIIWVYEASVDLPPSVVNTSRKTCPDSCSALLLKEVQIELCARYVTETLQSA